MKTHRNTGGFTLLELALAVAIIGILSGVTAVNVVHYQRTLTQVELDGIAREIFVAAQNHLTMAESQGFMGISDSYVATKLTATKNLVVGVEYKDASDTYYYYVVNDTLRADLKALNDLNMLDLMLPFASVDETVRTTGGSYVIRYQKNPALVLDVFYAPTTGKFPHIFTEQEADTLWECRGNESEKKDDRGHYPPPNGTAIIGWYGVDEVAGKWENKTNPEDPVQKGEPLSPPTIKIVNAEQLYVEVTNPNRVDRENPKTSEWYENARLHLEITGVRSGNRLSIELMNNAGFPSDKVYIIPVDDTFYPKTYRVILDDVTQNTTRFYKIMGGAGLYPGEDITICAVSYNNKELTNIATSASSTTNSLFSSVSGTTASIANFRHLENLDSNISNLASGVITDAKQAGDMDWTTFCKNIRNLRGLPEGEKINVFADSNVSSKDNCYLPVTNAETIAYDGKGFTIRNVKIDVPEGAEGAGDAGLFATLGHDSTVTDLELVNFDVQSSDGNAGALAGVLADKSKVQGVLVHHDIDKSGDNYKVTGKFSTGGLIGLIDGACTVTQSAAAVYVKSTSNTGNAGGLIGKIDNASGTEPVKVSDSYAGGHTKHKYTNQDGDTVEAGYQGDYCRIEEHSADHWGHYNVTAYASAGGLIGSSLGSLTVENCYATTSVKADANAGGFIGDITGGTISNCYVTGYVTGGTNKGAFAGQVNGSGTNFSDSGYFTAPENESEPLDPDYSGIISFYKDKDYSKFGGYPPKDAEPYDATLGYKYLFKTISELDNGVTAPDWMKKHYGDWPFWNEVLVVNELAS